MNDEQIIWKLYEANLFSKNPLHLELEKILKEKNVTKQPIKDWFLKTYIKWFTSPNEDDLKTDFIQRYEAQETDPEWARKEDVMQFKGFTPEYIEKLNHIVDFLDTRDENYLRSLYKVTIPQINQAVQEWDEQMRAASEKSQKEKIHSVEKEDYYIEGIYDGYPVWGLKSNKAFREESLFMGHCVGQADTDRDGVKSLEGGESRYFKQYKERKKIIYSLRDPSKNFQPVVTFDVSTPFMSDYEVQEIKGRYNEPPDRKYWKACELFIRDQKMIVKGDGEYIGMKYWDQKERFYFDREFKTILKKYIIPQRDHRIKIIRRDLDSENVYEGDIDISNLFYDELPDLSDIIIKGNFNCSNNNLKTLKGSPKYVSEIFKAEECNLESLEGGPILVGHAFNVYGNKLTSLEHSPRMVGNGYECRGNQLKSLKGRPELIGGGLALDDIDANLLKDLSGLQAQTVLYLNKDAQRYITLDKESMEYLGIKSHDKKESHLFVDKVQDKIDSEIQKLKYKKEEDTPYDRDGDDGFDTNTFDEDDDPIWDDDSEEPKFESFKKFFMK